MHPPNARSARPEHQWRRPSIALFVLALFTMNACVPAAATELVIRVESDIVATDLASIELTVRPADDLARTRFHRVYNLASREFTIPGEVGIVARDHYDASRVQVDVLALLRNGDRVPRTAIVSFQPRRVLVLEMFLADRCRSAAARAMCGPNETCGRLTCENRVVPVLDIDAGRADGNLDVMVRADAPGEAAPDVRTETGSDAACVLACDDGVFCNGVETCVANRCMPGVAPACDDSIDCTVDECPAGGPSCTHTPRDSVCNTAAGGTCNVSTGCQYPTCTAATCVSTPCVSRTCDASGHCVATPACRAGQMCCGNACVPTGCDDGNACTADSCAATGCVNAATPGTTCDDHDACTTVDRCSGSICMGSIPPNCDDGNPCTTDSCVAATGCTRGPSTSAACSDGDPCTVGDRCVGSACTGTVMDCNDGVSCNSDVCMGGSCTHLAVPGACSGGVCDEGGCCSEGPCRYVPAQCGCLPGRACYITSSTPIPYCAAPGLADEGQLCIGPNAQSCSAGNACGFSGVRTNPGICMRYCSSNADCPGIASRCVLTVPSTSAMVCSLTCDPESGMGCPAPYSCNIFVDMGQLHTHCINNPGAGTQNMACTTTADCAAGYNCSGNMCRHWCRRGSASPFCTLGTTCRVTAGVTFGPVTYDLCQ